MGVVDGGGGVDMSFDLWLVARGGCDTYAQCDEKAFISAHSYI